MMARTQPKPFTSPASNSSKNGTLQINQNKYNSPDISVTSTRSSSKRNASMSSHSAKRRMFDEKPSISNENDKLQYRFIDGIDEEESSSDEEQNKKTTATKPSKNQKMSDLQFTNMIITPGKVIDNVFTPSNKFPDNISSQLSMNSSSEQVEINYPIDEGSKLSNDTKTVLIGAIRSQTFRSIKFLTNQKLSQNSSIFQLMYEKAMITTEHEKKYYFEEIRCLIQRQMNSKRNYCTDQIVVKAKGKLAKMINIIFIPWNLT
jgi:hypothetical protein